VRGIPDAVWTQLGEAGPWWLAVVVLGLGLIARFPAIWTALRTQRRADRKADEEARKSQERFKLEMKKKRAEIERRRGRKR
jgi:hypothetical protein